MSKVELLMEPGDRNLFLQSITYSLRQKISEAHLPTAVIRMRQTRMTVAQDGRVPLGASPSVKQRFSHSALLSYRVRTAPCIRHPKLCARKTCS